MNTERDEGAPLAVPSGAAAWLSQGSKITTGHLARRALIYVRQSSPIQVVRHPESARRQYGLAERAQDLGWAAEQITIIDEDQGKSAAGSAQAHEREGFARLVSAVGLGEVGIILALEVARLARNSVEWYRLLELAALAGTLIADEDAIYDPRTFNDRLLLGLRGTISEVELHCIQARLQGARWSKVQRGEFRLGLPIGYVHGADGQIDFDPDQEVQGAVRTIFAQFAQLGKASAVLAFFRDHGLRFPRRAGQGPAPRPVVWLKPSYQAIQQVLVNPTYAGAYTYGQRRQEASAVGLGARAARHRFALAEMQVLLRDHHPAYLSWAEYLANRAKLRDNCSRFAASRGAPRAGIGLLQGILYCGRCGCRMQPHYSPSSPSYVCRARKQRYGEPVCQSLAIAHIDAAVSAAFLAVIQPAGVAAALALADELARDQAQVERQWHLRLERARYEAERTRRQFDLVEPEDRLVARELEHRWNDKLRALAELEREYQHEHERGLAPVTDAERTALQHLVADVSALWAALDTTMDERKRLLRCLVNEVIVTRDQVAKAREGITTLRIGWRSGAWSELAVRRPGSSEHLVTPAPIVARMRSLARCASDGRIAAVLNAEGLRTVRGLPWTAFRVQGVRRQHHIPTDCPALARGPEPRGDGLLPLAVAAARLGVVPTALAYWGRLGFVQMEQQGKGAPLWVRLTDHDRARLDGTLAAQGYGLWRVREAQRQLGLSESQLRDAAQQGSLVAYRIRVAHHWEWRISPAGVQSQTGDLVDPPTRLAAS
jgi:DNA invertase Pin-like site-specific DNA recombinase